MGLLPSLLIGDCDLERGIMFLNDIGRGASLCRPGDGKFLRLTVELGDDILLSTGALESLSMSPLGSVMSESFQISLSAEADVMDDLFDLGIAFRFIDKSTTAVDRAASCTCACKYIKERRFRISIEEDFVKHLKS